MNIRREGSNENYGRIDIVNNISFYSAFNSDKCLIHYEYKVVSKEKDVTEKDIHLYKKIIHTTLLKELQRVFIFFIKVDYEPTFSINMFLFFLSKSIMFLLMCHKTNIFLTFFNQFLI